MSERSGSEANSAIRGIEDWVEALEEGEAIDEVETRASVGTDTVDNQVDIASGSSNESVQGTRPCLGVYGELESDLDNRDVRINGYSVFKNNETLTPLIRKNKLCRLENCVVVKRSKPVFLSETAPVARW